MCCFCGNSYAKDGDNDVKWIIYLSVGPSSAVEISRFNGKNVDVTGYSYPLYVGYIYSKDLKNVEWHAEVNFVASAMQFWSEDYLEYPLVFKDGLDSPIKEIVPGSKKLAWFLDDPEFLEAAVLLMQWDTHMRPIRWQRDVPIDKDWKPVFPKQVRIVGTPEQVENNVYSLARDADDKLKPGDSIPINWDRTQNAPLGNKK